MMRNTGFGKSRTQVAGVVALVFVCIGLSISVVSMILRSRHVNLRLEQALSSESSSFLLTFGLSVGLLGITLYLIRWSRLQILQHIAELTQYVQNISPTNLDIEFPFAGDNEVKDLSEAIIDLTKKLKQDGQQMEDQAKLQLIDLEQKNFYLEACVKAFLNIGAIRDAERLIQYAVEFIRTQFNFYFVGLYLTDPDGCWIVLQAGTGKAGQDLLSCGYRIHMGEGMVGWVAENGKSKISMEIGLEAAKRALPELPLTRSEAVLPIRVGNRIIGAISIQSERTSAFDQLLLENLQLITDIIALALENLRLINENQTLSNNHKDPSGGYLTQEWSSHLSKQSVLGYQSTSHSLLPILLDDAETYLASINDVAKLGNDRTEMHMPIMIRGKLLGYLLAHKTENVTDEGSEWNKNEVKLMQDLMAQLNVALENSILLYNIQKSAERERKLSEVTAQVRASTSVDTILRSAILKLSEALKVPKGSIYLKPVHSYENGLSEEVYVDKTS